MKLVNTIVWNVYKTSVHFNTTWICLKCIYQRANVSYVAYYIGDVLTELFIMSYIWIVIDLISRH